MITLLKIRPTDAFFNHFRMHEDVKLYETPAYFTSDWLNEYCVDKGKDDYRFVYLGSTGSW